MRIDRDDAVDVLYVTLDSGKRAPARIRRIRQIAEGTLVDLDDAGNLIGIEVICPHRDWTVELEEILGEYNLSPADADELRAVAAKTA